MRINKMKITICALFVLLVTLSGPIPASAEPHEVIVDVGASLLESSIALDFIENNLNPSLEVKDTKVEFTDDGLQLKATKLVKFFPNVKFMALIDIRSSGDNQVELLIRKARVYGVELKWLSAKLVKYVEKKMTQGNISDYMTIAKKGWVKESGQKRAYSIVFQLDPAKIVNMVESPVIKDITVNSKALTLSVNSCK